VGGVETETAGCQPEQAIDQLAGTGFSADRDASPPSFVVRLPRLVAVTGFGVDPGNACGDAAGSTTTRFALAVSEDGATWHESVHQLGVSAAHVRTELAAGAGAGRVRYVRLRLLATHDPQAPFIDFSELSVYGNALPTAHLRATTPVLVGQPVQFDAGGSTDPDGTVARYEWDFDGNGSVDRATTSPATSFAYGAAGSYPAAVTVVDDRDGRERVAGTITVTAPPAPPPPPPPPPPPRFDDPVIVVPRSGSRGRVIVRVRCDAACFGTLRLTVDRRTARRLRLSRTVGRAPVRLAQAGERRIAVRLSRKAVRAMRRARRRSVRVRLSGSVRDIGARSTSVRRRVRIRR
jgi:YD repeat-containing protein